MIRLLVVFFLISFYTVVSAQINPKKFHRGPGNTVTRQEADSLRTAIMNRELLLSPAEASRFWPVFQAQLEELQLLNKNYFMWFNANKDKIQEFSKGELDDFLKKQDEYYVNKFNLRKHYDQAYRRILSTRQLAHFYVAEEKFSRQLIRFRLRKGLLE